MKTLFQKMRDNRQKAARRKVWREIDRLRRGPRASAVDVLRTLDDPHLAQKFSVVKNGPQTETQQQRWYKASAWFNKGQGMKTPLNCDQIAWILAAINRYLPPQNAPAVSRAREMQGYALLYEIMEVADLCFADDSAAHNGTPRDVQMLREKSSNTDAAVVKVD